MIKQGSLFTNEEVTRSDRSLHTPGNFARRNLLYVQEVGRLQSLKPHRCIREKVDSFLFLTVLEGKGVLEVNGKHYALERGACALVDCMEHYEHISDEAEGWQLAWVHFNGNAARGYYDLFCKYNTGNVFTVSDTESWNRIIGELLERQKNKDFLVELECGELLLQLLNRIVRSVAAGSDMQDETERNRANDIREFLNEQYADAEVLKELAENFAGDTGRLNQSFRRYMGISVEEYINNRRLNAAKELLRFTVKPVEEVAAESGIGDVIALQQMFTASEGMTAEEYRMKWAQWIR